MPRRKPRLRRFGLVLLVVISPATMISGLREIEVLLGAIKFLAHHRNALEGLGALVPIGQVVVEERGKVG